MLQFGFILAAVGEAFSQLLTSCRIYLAGPYWVPSSQLETTGPSKQVETVLIRSLSNVIGFEVQLLYRDDVSLLSLESDVPVSEW